MRRFHQLGPFGGQARTSLRSPSNATASAPPAIAVQTTNGRASLQPSQSPQTANSFASPPPIQPTENIAIPATSAANPTAKAVPAAAGESPAAKITGMKSTAPRPHSQLGIVIVVVSRSAATITRAGKTAEMTKLNKSVSLSLVVADALHRGAGD